MIVTRVPFDLYLPPSKTPRTPGIHCSNVIRCIAAESGILAKQWVEDLKLIDVREITDPIAILRISIGLAWEEWFIPNILGPSFGVIDHPGEYEVDGIYMTPDGESVSVIITDRERAVLVVHEVKATYKSTKTVGDVEGQWMWLAQIKSYCKALKTTVAMLHVLFICGDYSYPISPQLTTWKIEFTQDEIDLNWHLLTEYRDKRQGEA